MAHHHWTIDAYLAEVQQRMTDAGAWRESPVLSGDRTKRSVEREAQGIYRNQVRKALPSWSFSTEEVSARYGNNGAMLADEMMQPVDFINRCHTGDSRLVTRAEQLVDKFTNIDIDLQAYKWDASPMGAFPVIPEYLSDRPDSMRIRRKQFSDLSPIHVYVGSSISSGMGYQLMTVRGMAVTALLMLLERFRPVKLSLWEDSGTTVPGEKACISTVEIGTSPWSIAQVAFLISSATFSRNVMYSMATNMEGLGTSFPNFYLEWGGEKGSPKYINWLREYVGAEETDLFVPAGFFPEMAADPEKWVHDKLTMLTGREDLFI